MEEPGMPDPRREPIPVARVVPPRHSAAIRSQAQTFPGPGIIPAPGPLRGLVFTILGIPLAVVVLIAIVVFVTGGGSGDGNGQYPYGGGDGAGLPQFSFSSTTDPNSGDSPADEPQTQSTLASSDEAGQTPTTGLSDTPTDSFFGTDSGTTADSGSPADAGAATSTATSAASSATTGPSTPAATGPASTVTAYFAAINAQDYPTAWNLGGKNLDGSSLAHFSAGFAQTAQDTVTIVGVDGDVVSVDLTSQQRDGTQKSFSGTYTVVGGVITSASVTQTG